MLKIKFEINVNKIEYFANIQNINKNTFEMKNLKLKVEDLKYRWQSNEYAIYKILYSLFKNNINFLKIGAIIIYLFPSNFFLGACETKKKIILFGQPCRSDNFDLAIITHEIGHIILSNIKQTRPIIIDETICFFLETKIYSLIDNLSIDQIRNENELDYFHKLALKYSKLLFNSSNTDKNVEELISFLYEIIDKNDLDVKPEKGLINNLTKANI